MFTDALFKDTYRKYGDGTIVVHVAFWTAFVDRCYKSNFKARRYDPCCNGKVDDVCHGLCDYDSNIFEKTWPKVVRSSGLFTLKFLQLDKYLRDSDGYQFKSKFGFRFGLVWRRPNEVLKPD